MSLERAFLLAFHVSAGVTAGAICSAATLFVIAKTVKQLVGWLLA